MPRILVIDDSAVQRILTRSALEGASHQVLIAEDGKVGLEVVHRERDALDCILLDWLMPVISGVDVLRILQTEGNTIPVIVVTGEDNDDIRAECSQLGATAVVEKPRDIQDLLVTLDSVLERSK